MFGLTRSDAWAIVKDVLNGILVFTIEMVLIRWHIRATTQGQPVTRVQRRRRIIRYERELEAGPAKPPLDPNGSASSSDAESDEEWFTARESISDEESSSDDDDDDPAFFGSPLRPTGPPSSPANKDIVW
ncbi:hypothetical protein KEM52_006618 [Ascosphaera acerosa]|nr:hypothetical protein KEM52_006618 [Ascosphaera acerosa]